MKKHLFVIGIIFLFVGLGFQPAYANDVSIGNVEQQPRGITFKKIYGEAEEDNGYFVQQTTDGGYIITGQTWSFGAGKLDVWLIKTDNNGNMKWDKTFGGTEYDGGMCVRQTNDGGYIIVGIKDSDHDNYGDIWLIKTDSNGNKEWDKTFGSARYDIGAYIQLTTDGGYIITGKLSGRVCLIKTNSSGNVEWTETYPGNMGKCVQQTTDGGYIIIGSRSDDYWLLKTYSNGSMEWEKTFHKKKRNIGECVQQTTDGGYILTGYAEWWDYPEFTSVIWVIKTDSNGNKVWDKVYERLEFDYSEHIQQTTDGGYIITGSTVSLIGNSNNIWLIKTDSAGNRMWDRTFGGIMRDAYGKCVQQTTDGGYIIVGDYERPFGSNDIWLIKTNKNGRLISKGVTNNMLFRLLERFPLISRLLNIG
jgi:hypothetical protein